MAKGRLVRWHPGAPTGPGTPLHHVYRQATTVTWLGIVACQIGSAFAVRTDHASLRSVGLFTNKALLGAIAVALIFAAGLVYLPFLHGVFGTEALTPAQLATVVPFPFIVWGSDEIRRLLLRRHHRSRSARTRAGAGPPGAGETAPESSRRTFARRRWPSPRWPDGTS
jgi:magnesium-transporting ATPase (P-type)